jgi:hypothetical protein
MLDLNMKLKSATELTKLYSKTNTKVLSEMHKQQEEIPYGLEQLTQLLIGYYELMSNFKVNVMDNDG